MVRFWWEHSSWLAYGWLLLGLYMTDRQTESSSYKGTNPMMGVLLSGPDLNLIIFRRFCLQTPLQWRLGLQHENLGDTVYSVILSKEFYYQFMWLPILCKWSGLKCSITGCVGGSVVERLTQFWLRSWSQGREVERCIGFHAQQGACLRFSLSLTLCPSPWSPLLSLSNKWTNLKKKKKK